MFPCARQTVINGGRTAEPHIPAKRTGTKAGIGLQGLTSAQFRLPATLSHFTSQHQPPYVRTFGVILIMQALMVRAVANASTRGSTQPRETPVKLWLNFMLLPLPQASSVGEPVSLS